MEQSNSTSYVSSPYPSMMDLPSANMSYCSASNNPSSPDARQHSFDETAYFSPGSQEILHFPVSRVAEGSLDPWLMEMPGTASTDSSRLSMSPSQGIATPPLDALYSPPYPEHLQPQMLEKPQSVRSGLTSHPNWASSSDNWECAYAENSMWSTQPFVAQPWIPNTYDGYAPSHMHPIHAQINQRPLPAFSVPAQDQFPVQEPVQTGVALDSPAAGNNEDTESSEEDSDSDEDASDYNGCSSHTSVARSRIRAQGSRVDRWIIPTSAIQQSITRGYSCHFLDCTTAFVRPEHLRRHIRSKHNPTKDYPCVIPGCNTYFSRGDNLRDHYWTHLQRGGRNGKNKKYTLAELRVILSKEKKLLKRLREKLRKYQLKEQKKREEQPAQPAYVERSKL